MNYRLIALLFLLYASSVFANDQDAASEMIFPQQMTAKELHYFCGSSTLTSKGRERGQYCTGFISGVEEATRFLRATAEQSVCMPPDVSSRALKEMYIRYALRNQQLMNKPAAEIVLLALHSAFPCPE